MKLKIWNKTTIVWGLDDGMFALNTDILVDDWIDKKQKYFHTLVGMRVVSLNESGQREALMELTIRRVSIGPTTALAKITERLMHFDPSVIGVHNKLYTDSFTVRYRLNEKENFCDSAISRARQLFTKLGIEDKDDDRLANFLTIQESLVKDKKDFIPFADYLRQKHGLKQSCDLWGRKIDLGNAIYTISYPEAESNWLRN
jgi:hypothetical protein